MRPIAALALVLPLASGCAALLGVGAGVVISQEVVEGETHVAHLNEDATRVWAVTKSTLSHMASEPIDVDEDLRTATGKVDGANVSVGVEVYDLNRSLLRVSARKYGVSSGEIAEMVLNRVVGRLSE